MTQIKTPSSILMILAILVATGAASCSSSSQESEVTKKSSTTQGAPEGPSGPAADGGSTPDKDANLETRSVADAEGKLLWDSEREDMVASLVDRVRQQNEKSIQAGIENPLTEAQIESTLTREYKDFVNQTLKPIGVRLFRLEKNIDPFFSDLSKFKNDESESFFTYGQALRFAIIASERGLPTKKLNQLNQLIDELEARGNQRQISVIFAIADTLEITEQQVSEIIQFSDRF